MRGNDGMSLQNKGELQMVQKLLETEITEPINNSFYFSLCRTGGGCKRNIAKTNAHQHH